MGERLDAVGERLRDWWSDWKMTRNLLIVVVVAQQLGWIPTPVANAIRDLILVQEEQSAQLSGIDSQLDGISDVTARGVAAGIVGEPVSTAELASCRADLAQMVRIADDAEIDRQQAWAGRDRAIDEAINQVSNELAASQARVKELEAQNADKVVFSRAEWDAAQRGDLAVLCSNR